MLASHLLGCLKFLAMSNGIVGSQVPYQDLMEQEMATHFSTPAWKIPWSPWGRKELGMTEWLHFLSFYSSFWRRKWQPTPVFLPRESHGQRGLVGYSLWGCKELDTTKEHTHSSAKCNPGLRIVTSAPSGTCGSSTMKIDGDFRKARRSSCSAP